MAATIVSLTRIFRYDGIDLPDPDVSAEPTEVLNHYAQQYPRLSGGKVVEPVVDGDSLIFELRQGGFGDKG